MRCVLSSPGPGSCRGATWRMTSFSNFGLPEVPTAAGGFQSRASYYCSFCFEQSQAKQAVELLIRITPARSAGPLEESLLGKAQQYILGQLRA